MRIIVGLEFHVDDHLSWKAGQNVLEQGNPRVRRDIPELRGGTIPYRPRIPADESSEIPVVEHHHTFIPG